MPQGQLTSDEELVTNIHTSSAYKRVPPNLHKMHIQSLFFLTRRKIVIVKRLASDTISILKALKVMAREDNAVTKVEELEQLKF